MTIFDTAAMVNTYEERKLGRETLDNGLIVSTAYTTDEGYETGIFSTKMPVSPVERYSTKELAEIGHSKWITFAKEGLGKEILVLGCYEDNWETHKEIVRV
jgi:hypothetical protein